MATMNTLHRTLALALLAALGLTSCSNQEARNSSTASTQNSATVIRVIDGDTVDVSLDGEETRIRLLNVDTPETKHPNKAVECLGPEASSFLEEKLPAGSKVSLEYDLEKTDSYGRTLAGVFLANGEFVNEEIARAGLGTAVLIEPNSKFYERVLKAQNSAISSGRGLFDDSVSCSLPAQVKGLEEALAGAGTAEAAQSLLEEASSLLDLLENTPTGLEYAFLAGFQKSQMGESLIAQLSGLVDSASTKVSDLQAAEKRAAEQAEAERLAAEQAAAAEAERIAAEQAAEAERQAQAQINQPPAPAPAPNPAPEQNQPAPAPEAEPAPNPYPGYTGPRCYAPGGKTWTPCPNR